MSTRSTHKLTDRSRIWGTLGPLALRGLLLCGLWAVLADGEGWGFGVPVALGAAWLSLRLAPPSAHRIRLLALPRFAGWFLWQSLRAGWDVARRTLHPALPLDPGMIRLRPALPVGAPTWWLMLVISLLPGTLSVRMAAGTLELHCLDAGGDVAGDVAQAEGELARLFGLQVDCVKSESPE